MFGRQMLFIQCIECVKFGQLFLYFSPLLQERIKRFSFVVCVKQTIFIVFNERKQIRVCFGGHKLLYSFLFNNQALFVFLIQPYAGKAAGIFFVLAQTAVFAAAGATISASFRAAIVAGFFLEFAESVHVLVW
jgi:hypothetical protein